VSTRERVTWTRSRHRGQETHKEIASALLGRSRPDNKGRTGVLVTQHSSFRCRSAYECRGDRTQYELEGSVQ
jgi:hypothetical protein